MEEKNVLQKYDKLCSIFVRHISAAHALKLFNTQQDIEAD